MKKVAFVTYNTVGKAANGWHDGSDGRRALVVQNTKGHRWAAREEQNKPSGNDRTSETYVARVHREIDAVWEQLQTALPDLDHVVVYVGAAGSEHAIELASRLPKSNLTFVNCSCDRRVKEMLLQTAGVAKVPRISCECGGHATMGRLFTCFMDNGTLYAD